MEGSGGSEGWSTRMTEISGRVFYVWAAAVAGAATVLLQGCRRDRGETDLAAGMAALEEQAYESAVQHLERAAKKQPVSASAYCNLGIAYWKLGRIERAVSSLTVAADLIGPDPLPLELLAQVYADARRWEEARDVLDRLSNGMPDTPRILTWQALVEYRAGETSAARDFLKRALVADPTYGPALYDMAVLYKDLPGGRPTAETLFEKYLEYFATFREKRAGLEADPDRVEQILQDGARRARELAKPVLARVRQAVGLT